MNKEGGNDRGSVLKRDVNGRGDVDVDEQQGGL